MSFRGLVSIIVLFYYDEMAAVAFYARFPCASIKGANSIDYYLVKLVSEYVFTAFIDKTRIRDCLSYATDRLEKAHFFKSFPHLIQ